MTTVQRKTTASNPAVPGSNSPPAPATHEQIAHRAYDIYLKTGRAQGRCTENWQLAEKSLRDQARERRQEDSSVPFVPRSINPR